MSIASDIDRIASTPKPRARWALIRAALHERGVTLTEIGQRCGVVRQAVSQAAYIPSEPVETAIAEALGAPVQKLFPDRYDATTGERTVRSYRKKNDPEAA
jgi:lambda repressor-like predicted transcriptional regulator